MKRLLPLCLLVLTSCSTRPLADLADFFKPGQISQDPKLQPFGGVCLPQGAPTVPIGVPTTPAIAVPVPPPTAFPGAAPSPPGTFVPPPPPQPSS